MVKHKMLRSLLKSEEPPRDKRAVFNTKASTQYLVLTLSCSTFPEPATLQIVFHRLQHHRRTALTSQTKVLTYAFARQVRKATAVRH